MRPVKFRMVIRGERQRGVILTLETRECDAKGKCGVVDGHSFLEAPSKEWTDALIITSNITTTRIVLGETYANHI